MKLIKLNQPGETIVEVMLAITVIASVIGGTFAISTRSRNTIQANQERYQAQLIANSQADNIKIYMSQNNNTYNTSIRCFKDSLPKTIAVDCQNVNSLYNISITENPAHIFVINVVWDSLMGEQDKVVLVYGS